MKTIPWGPLYEMNNDELLALRKILTEYLEEFVKISHSPAAALVLLAYKHRRDIRFYVNYRSLNAVIKKD
jgi:hypothetical protein